MYCRKKYVRELLKHMKVFLNYTLHGAGGGVKSQQQHVCASTQAMVSLAMADGSNSNCGIHDSISCLRAQCIPAEICTFYIGYQRGTHSDELTLESYCHGHRETRSVCVERDRQRIGGVFQSN